MLQFLKFTFATMVGIVLLTLIFIGLAALLIPDDKPKVKDKTVLVLQLNKPIKERTIDNPLSELIDNSPFPDGESGEGLLEIRTAIRGAAKDSKIKGIFLKLSSTSAGFASLQEIRDELIAFKKSKKFIYAYADNYSEGAYYIASVADRIYLNPKGLVEFNGLSAEILFFKGALEKLEIKPEIFRVGTYKSAVEPFINDKMSEANREQYTSFLNSIYDFYLENVAKSRNIDLTELTRISDELLVQNAQDALRYKLVTQLANYDEVLTDLKKAVGTPEKEDLETIGPIAYSKTVDEVSTAANKIAVIFATGEIDMGKSTNSKIGGESLAQEIRKVRQDKNVKAVVLRINSPGGSALASDIIWREVALTKKVKPIVASMSDVAASGGYYIAMECNKILAHENTITGSIGVFGIFFNTENMFKNKLGITYDRVRTGNFSDIGNPNRSFTDKEKEIIQKSVNQVYETFTQKAAKGRNMPLEKLKAVAEGRVWSGKEAKSIGLIDEFGGLDEAIKVAAKEAKLKEGDYRLRYLPVQKNFFEQLTEGFKTLFQIQNAESTLQRELGMLYPYYKLLKDIQTIQPIQARMPVNLIIR
ncbi:MAG: signal peptide peptidase SppA [Microscillaceae bacterium]|nr:signal peptide peptidase SppA [Microscillaceae bacterium]MDW8459640.1 signal peptide peptidase SppA [Cytophagales bacterium]